ncbi:MAG: hypothetical protein QN229_00615 [Desulfurococcaceae archaeon TW002]
MFSVRYSEGLLFRKYVLSSTKPLSDVPLRVSEDGFLIRGLSPDKSVLVELSIPGSSFTEFSVSGVNDLTLERDEISKVLKKVGKNDSIQLNYDEGSGSVRAKLVNSKSGVERSYEIRVAALEGPVDPIQIELPVVIRVETSILQRIIKEAKLIGEELTIRCFKDVVEFTSLSEGREYRTSLERGKHLLELTSNVSGAVSSTYDIDLLKTIIPILTIFDVATLELGPSLPLKISLTGEDGVSITSWIAPR